MAYSRNRRSSTSMNLDTIDGTTGIGIGIGIGTRSTDENDSLLESFGQQPRDDFMSRSEAESTALSSVLPVVASSKVRASAPRAELPMHHNSHGHGYSHHASAADGMTAASSTNNSYARANGGSTTTNKKEKDLDEYTVETNRPIDSVYIYPNEPTQPVNRQRRAYRTSTNGSISSTGLRSIGGSSGGTGPTNTKNAPGDASHASSAVSGAGSVGGILDTLGLSAGDIEDNTTVYDDTTYGSHSKAYSDTKSRSYTTVSRNTGTSRGRPRRRRGTISRATNASGPHVHMRAALVLFFLLSILYGAFQWIAMVKANSRLNKNNKNKKSKHKYRAFEEGEDRPMDKVLLGKITSSAGKISEKLAKGPRNDEGPNNLLDKKIRKKYIDSSSSGLDNYNNDENKVLPNEKAPLDSLASIDQQQQQQQQKGAASAGADGTTPGQGAVLSFAVQSGLAGVYSKDPQHKDLPFLWYIPRSGGGIVKNILSNCKGLTVASEVGATIAKKGDPSLEVVDVGGHKYVNVDTTTESGISEAKALGLASSGLAQLVVSPRFQEGSSLFGASKKGRAFCMLRHPVERAVSMFYFLKKHNVPAVASMSLEDYCKSPHVENNWMVRILSDRMTGDITDDDLEVAKTVFREKLIVGLLEQKEESMRRFEYHFNWKYTENPQRQATCRTRILVGDYRTNESAKGKIKEGSQAWSLLMWQNKLDMKLYKYAKALFLQQGTELFNDMP